MLGKKREKIREIATELDDAIERGNLDDVLDFFADDCEIEFMGLKMRGKEEAEKWFRWLYGNLSEIRFRPVTLMVEGNKLFEEFVMKAKMHDGKEVQSKQAEILDFRRGKVKSLRIYFNVSDFSQTVGSFLKKAFVHKFVAQTIKGIK